jgi:hypothetical protein
MPWCACEPASLAGLEASLRRTLASANALVGGGRLDARDRVALRALADRLEGGGFAHRLVLVEAEDA